MPYRAAKVVKQLFLGAVGLVVIGVVTWVASVLVLLIASLVLIFAGGAAEILPGATVGFGFRGAGVALFALASFLLGVEIVERMD